jgi:hypothetical protein
MYSSVKYFRLILWIGLQSVILYASIHFGRSRTWELYNRFPLWNSVYTFLGYSTGITFWVTVQWVRLAAFWLVEISGRFTSRTRKSATDLEALRRNALSSTWRWTRIQIWVLLPPTALVLFWHLLDRCNRTVIPSGIAPTKIGGLAEPIFVAANLYNSKDIWAIWSKQVLALIDFGELATF